MTSKKLKVTITLDMTIPEGRDLINLSSMCRALMIHLAEDTAVVPWHQGYTGKMSVQCENDEDSYMTWCFLEELSDQSHKMEAMSK